MYQSIKERLNIFIKIYYLFKELGYDLYLQISVIYILINLFCAI